MTTEHGVCLKYVLKKIVLIQNMVLVLNLDSQKYSLHQPFLYTWQCESHSKTIFYS